MANTNIALPGQKINQSLNQSINQNLTVFSEQWTKAGNFFLFSYFQMHSWQLFINFIGRWKGKLFAFVVSKTTF